MASLVIQYKVASVIVMLDTASRIVTFLSFGSIWRFNLAVLELSI